MERSISQYDYMLATTPEPEPDECRDDPFRLAASMMRESLRLIAEVYAAEPSDGAVLAWRFSGMSLAQIGDRMGMSKQAVHKRIMRMAARWPQLARALTATAELDPYLADSDMDVMKSMQKTTKIWREATRWMSKPN